MPRFFDRSFSRGAEYSLLLTMPVLCGAFFSCSCKKKMNYFKNILHFALSSAIIGISFLF